MTTPPIIDFAGELAGRKVTVIRLASNSLLIYLDCEPGDETSYTFWLDPTWHVVSSDAVLAGSRQAQVEADEEQSELEKLDEISAMLNPLVGRAIISVQCEAVTNDLRVTVDGGFEFRTFVSDPTSTDNWHLRDNALGKCLYGSSHGFLVSGGASN